jgi:dynein heavy chain
MQQRVHKLTQKYLAELKRYYYVTPTSYLVLLKAFKQLLADKRKVIGSEIKKYDVGLKQLADASSQVDTLSQELQDLIPQLQKKAKETGAMMVEIETQKKFVAEKTKEAKAEEAVASAKKEEASTIQKDCELQLAKVEPIAHAAIKAVDQLNKKDITELKSFKTVGEPVACVAEGMCIMFNVPPVRENGSKPGEKINNWWKAA